MLSLVVRLRLFDVDRICLRCLFDEQINDDDDDDDDDDDKISAAIVDKTKTIWRKLLAALTETKTKIREFSSTKLKL